MRLITAAAGSVLALSLAACANDPTMATNAAAADLNGAPTAAAEQVMTATYVVQAAQSDMYEIRSSQMALSKASSQQVKDFAKMMVSDHTMTSQKLKDALSSANQPPPPMALDDRRKGMLDQLSHASGADFDRMYIQQQLMAHQEALTLHQSYAANGDERSLKVVANATVPIIQHHLSMLQAMAS